MIEAEALKITEAALTRVPVDLETAHGKRVYLAYLACRIAVHGPDRLLESRIAALRAELRI